MNLEDPYNSEILIEKIKKITDAKEIETFLEKECPGWVMFSFDKYSDDYKYLDDNWGILCNKLGVTKKKIILVFDLKFEEKYKTIQAFSEHITRLGYVVRRFTEFTPCTKCHAAIPVREVWEFMKSKNLPVPGIWADKCSSCSEISV